MTDILKMLDTEIAFHESQITKLCKARTLLAPPVAQAAPVKKPRKRRGTGKTASRNASRKVSDTQVQRVRETLADTLQGQASQHRIGQVAGMRSPEVSMAVRQLEAEGVVRRTGTKEGRSPVLEFVGAAHDGGQG